MSYPHQDVIVDLLPVYFAGEASVASGDLIEAYFAAHPPFARAMRAAQANSAPIPAHASGDDGKMAIKRIRSHLRWRSGLIGIAIFCSIMPFSFLVENNVMRYVMLRDAPATALMYAAAAAMAWIAVLIFSRRTNTE